MNRTPRQQSTLIHVNGLLIAVLVGAAFLVGGCGKKRDANTAGQSNSAGPEQIPSAPAPAAGNLPAVVPVVVAESNDASAQLAQLTQVLRRYGVERRRVPQSLNELITAGYLTTLPAAPSGKQYAIDGKHMQVVLANR